MKQMTKTQDQQTAQAFNARLVDAHAGSLGTEQVTAVETFTRQLLTVYLPKRIGGRDPTSPYAKHKPVRTLLKTYRMYRSLPPPERRFMMLAEPREVFLNPPQGILEPGEYEIEAKSQTVVDAFLNLLGFLYADIPSLVARHENRLLHAIDLAIDLHYWDVRNERDISRAEFLVRRLKKTEKEIHDLQSKGDLKDEERESLEKKVEEKETDEKNLQRILLNLREKAKREEDAVRLENMLKEEKENG
jgi:hypothetical protein